MKREWSGASPFQLLMPCDEARSPEQRQLQFPAYSRLQLYEATRSLGLTAEGQSCGPPLHIRGRPLWKPDRTFA